MAVFLGIFALCLYHSGWNGCHVLWERDIMGGSDLVAG